METWACQACGGVNPDGMRFCGHCGAPAVTTPAPVHAPPAEANVADALRSFVTEQVAERLIEAGGRIPEERRLITALFADVSGFTSLADRLDPEELLEVIDPVISALSSVVARYEGYVEKFAGDALLALFGAPVAHEDDAARALLVALEMHRELERVCAQLPHKPELTLHVGVNSGHGVARILGSEARMDYAVLGDSVILAQRLESAAPPGETYVSEPTFRLTEDRFEFEPVGELAVKGKREPVPAWRLLGERVVARPRGADLPARTLVGRERELALVTGALAELGEGRGIVLAVTGEPGMGKSRLTEDVRTLARSQGMRWLDTRCLSYGAGLAYWPYAELLRGWAGLESERPVTETASRLLVALEGIGTAPAAPYFGRLLGLPAANGDEIASLEPEAFRRGLHESFSSWARALAAEAPLVIAIEDVHWLDASSAALTQDLVRENCERTGFYLISRLEGGKLLAEFGATEIELSSLDEPGVSALVANLLEAPPPRDLVGLVADRSGGNPLFAEELVRSLRDTGALAREDGRWSFRRGWDPEELPPTIEGLLSSRIDALPRTDATVLQTASVIGRRVRIPVLEALEAGSDVGAALQRLVEAGFLDPVSGDGADQLVFHHALIQEAAYGRLLRRQRRDLHGRVAEVAEALYGAGDDVIELLARHLYLAEAGSKAGEYLRRAGERARRLYANDEAIVHFGRAAEIARREDKVGERLPALLLDLADLHELVGRYEDAFGLYSEVRNATNEVRAWQGMAATLRKRGEYEQALAVVEKAFHEPALEGADLTPLWLEQSWTLSLAGRLDQSIDVAEAGLAAAPSRGDPIAGQLLLQITRAETVEGHFEAALEHGLEALHIFEECGDLRLLATGLRLVGSVYDRLDRLDEAVATLRRGLEIAERVGNVEEIGGCLINLGLAELRRGALDAAIAYDRRAIEEFERIGHGSGRAGAYANLAEKLLSAGEDEEAIEYSAKALELARSIGNAYITADATQTLAAIRLRQGAFAEAAEWAEEAAALFEEIGASPSAVAALTLAAEAFEKSGEGERARDVSARARSLVVT